MRLSKIVVATDFSAGAAVAVAHAVRLARQHRAELVLAHAWGAWPALPGEAERMIAAGRQLAVIHSLRRSHGAEELARTLAHVSGAGVEARTVLREGAAARTVVAIAREENADLVVTGARGSGEDNVFVIGSVTEGIVRRSGNNVLVARGPAVAYSRVLLATDLAESSLAVVPMASAFAAPGAEIELLHVVDWGDRAPPIHGPFGSPAFDFKKLWRAAVEEAERELQFQLDRGRLSASVHHCVVDGLPAVEILKRAREGGHDLLVVGKHAAVLPAHQRVAERLMRHAPCSVLITRRVPGPRAVRIVPVHAPH